MEVEEVDDLGVKAVPASTLGVREVLLLVVAQRHQVDRLLPLERHDAVAEEERARAEDDGDVAHQLERAMRVVGQLVDYITEELAAWLRHHEAVSDAVYVGHRKQHSLLLRHVTKKVAEWRHASRVNVEIHTSEVVEDEVACDVDALNVVWVVDEDAVEPGVVTLEEVVDHLVGPENQLEFAVQLQARLLRAPPTLGNLVRLPHLMQQQRDAFVDAVVVARIYTWQYVLVGDANVEGSVRTRHDEDDGEPEADEDDTENGDGHPATPLATVGVYA